MHLWLNNIALTFNSFIYMINYHEKLVSLDSKKFLPPSKL